MSEAAVSAQGLVKRYGRVSALAGLDFNIPAGTLVGFLGPNGAGKTTTFRTLLGLSKLDEGTATVFGHVVRGDVAAVVGRVGAIVEGPAIYNTLSGSDNLRVCASIRREARDQIPELLELVGLTDRAGDKAGGYSKGMRQRLALAMALLGGPQLLLLDEPMDGLDPAGQVALRELLRSFVDSQGKTVVVSSHVLADIEQLADYVVLINHGRLVTEGPLSELVQGSGGVRVVVDDAARAGDLLEAAGMSAERRDNELIVSEADPRRVAMILANGGVYPYELGREQSSLERVFLELIEDSAP